MGNTSGPLATGLMLFIQQTVCWLQHCAGHHDSKVVAPGFQKPTVWSVGFVPSSAGFQVGKGRKCVGWGGPRGNTAPSTVLDLVGKPWESAFYAEVLMLGEVWG